MSSELISAIVGAVAAFLTTLPVLIPWFRDWRDSNKQEHKYAYIKVVHLTPREEGAQPVHRSRVARLGEVVDVFDEYHYFRLNIFRWQRKEFTCVDRSSGVVDLQILHPWNEGGKLVFPDKGAATQRGYVLQTIKKASNVFFTKSIYYNGLQDGNQDLAMKMEHDTREARLLVDFSSIPHCDTLVPFPTAVECIDGVETQITVRKLAPGIYSVSATNVKKETVLRMDFNFAWEAVRQSHAPTSA